MIKNLRLLSGCAIMLALSGCATMFGDKNRTVLVSSNPSDAKVYYHGAYVGNTPAAITVSNPLDTNTVEVKKEGYFEASAPVRTSVQASTFLNILFWPGFFVDLLTGDIKRVEPNLTINLNQANRTEASGEVASAPVATTAVPAAVPATPAAPTTAQ